MIKEKGLASGKVEGVLFQKIEGIDVTISLYVYSVIIESIVCGDISEKYA